jgi:hypothetical protein
MNLEQIENNIKKLISNVDQENFIYDFLLAYGQPKASINRLKKGDYNKSKNHGEIIWAKKVYFKTVLENEDVHDVIDEISKSTVIEKQKIRFIIVTNFKTFLAKDLKINDTLDIEFSKILANVDFFMPLTGIEKAKNILEHDIDIKAAEKLGKLFDLIINDNPELNNDPREKHGLNIFFTRILFCYFSEDSGIFDKGLFTRSIKSLTAESGQDLNIFLNNLFNVLKEENRTNLPEHFLKFPYVNGNLFKNDYKIPKFNKESRKLLIDIGELDWNSINPDILGSMMQAVVEQGVRHEIGMHYTSVNNILKVIKPLFLDDLYDDLISATGQEKKLKKLLSKIYNTIIFDPACGSGNFLVISYKELYKLEIEILIQLKEIDKNEWLLSKSGISLEQFYGIEIDDYAQEAAKLSLWIAQHQMNIQYKKMMNDFRPTLPLSPSGNITLGNATKLNWNEVCPYDDKKYFFVIGNPPYAGARLQSKNQKNDMEYVFGNIQKGHKDLDYISCWFFLGSKYIENKNAKLAFVSTNSIVQGEQVSLIWPNILNSKIEISFAYKSFDWKNNAKYNAGVTCVIISLRNISKNEKYIFYESKIKKAKNINAYLLDYRNIFIKKSSHQISELPKMYFGNMPVDNGNLILSENEKNDLINANSNAEKFIRPFIGAAEFIYNRKRYCLWIRDKNLDEANEIQEISKRLEKVKKFRLNSKNKGTVDMADKPYQFRGMREAKNNSLIIPSATSEKRDYIPIGFYDKKTIISNLGNVIYDPPIYIFPIISSKIHMIWVFAISGYLRMGVRYSIGISYNTFPFPKLEKNDQKTLEELALKLIDVREAFLEKSIADLYDKNNMPKKLKLVHNEIDEAVENVYKKNMKEFKDDKLNMLFHLYKKISHNELF